MADLRPTRKYICSRCGRHYSSSSHLRRHEAIHNADRPASCAFCHRTFLRSDVLLRHSRTCKQKGTRPVPPGKPGRQRKACNACALARVACDGEDPCETCLLRHRDCLYSHAQQRQALSGPSGDGPTCTPEEPERSNPQQIPISFLLDYTSPTIQSAYDFQHMLAEHSTGILDPGNQERRGSWLASDHVIDTWPFLFHAFINPAALSPPIQASGLMYGVDDEARLAETINRLILHLEQSAAPNARGTNFNRARARSFFSRENVVRSVNAFFDRVYNSNPIIYRASFNINTTSLNLVLAVLLLGATCLSPEDASAAEVYYEAAEYCIFEGQEFRRLLYEEEHPLLSAENIQLIQASLLIMLLGFKGPLGVRRRVRIQRFPALVSIVRLLDMTKAVNNIVLDEDLTNLQNYIHKETVVRLMAWIYLIDTHVVIFSRLPPQFRISEAQFGLPQQDAVFNAVDPTRLDLRAPKPTRQSQTWTLQMAVQQLMGDQLAGLEEMRPHIDTFFAHFLLIGALHSILFDVQALQSCSDICGATLPVERALDRWKFLWDRFQKRCEPQESASSGFMAHSLEYWWLAKMLVKEPRLFDSKAATVADSVHAFHTVLKDLKVMDAQ